MNARFEEGGDVLCLLEDDSFSKKLMLEAIGGSYHAIIGGSDAACLGWDSTIFIVWNV